MEEIKKLFKHLLIVSLIAFGISIISRIIVVILDTFVADFRELGIRHLPPEIMSFVLVGIFFFSCLIYFFYVIKKLKWFLGFIAVLIAIQIVSAIVSHFYVNVYSTNIHLPEQYNEYQDIKNPVLEFKNKEMRLLVRDSTKLNQYLSPQNNLILGPVDTIYDNKITNVYYKYDTKGNLMSRYNPSSNDEEILFEGFLINMDKEYYRLWAFNGDTLKRKMKRYNEKFSLDKKKQNAFLADIKEKSVLIFSQDFYKEGKSDGNFKKTIFVKDNKWNVFYSDIEKSAGLYSSGRTESDLFLPDSRLYSSSYSDSNIDKWDRLNASKNIQSQYYQKTESNGAYTDYKKVYPTHHEAWGTGYLYTNIIVDKDTLKIKEFVLIIDDDIIEKHPFKERFESPRYLYYSNPNLEYQLITNRSGKLYMIRDKPKIQKKT